MLSTYVDVCLVVKNNYQGEDLNRNTVPSRQPNRLGKQQDGLLLNTIHEASVSKHLGTILLVYELVQTYAILGFRIPSTFPTTRNEQNKTSRLPNF